MSADAQAMRCDEERQRALASSQRIKAEWPLRGKDKLTDYIGQLGWRLVHKAGYEHEAWRFIVVRNLSANAFSTGDGYIYVNEGALLKAGDESELAAVIAHEIGHQISGHFCNNVRGDEKSIQSWNPFDWIDQSDSQPQEQTKIGSITQKLDVVKEQEADRRAISLLSAAGFNPHAMLQVALRFPKFNSAAGTRNQQRVEALQYLLSSLPNRMIKNSIEFWKNQAKLKTQIN